MTDVEDLHKNKIVKPKAKRFEHLNINTSRNILGSPFNNNGQPFSGKKLPNDAFSNWSLGSNTVTPTGFNPKSTFGQNTRQKS